MAITQYPTISEPGYVFCTSSTRPTGVDGLMIYETDTKRRYVYDSTLTWRYLSGGTDPTAARAYATATTSITAGVTGVQVTLGGESYDYGNHFASNQYVVPRAGMLDARWGVSVTALSDGQRFFSSLYIDGAEVSRGTDGHIGAAASTGQSNGSDLIPVTFGQSVILWCVVLTTTRSTVADDVTTFLTCRMVP
jgi:hypothetical protein